MEDGEMGQTCSTNAEIGNAYKILVGRLEVRDHSEYLGVDGRIILKWNIGK
jgi:hypothetical protein